MSAKILLGKPVVESIVEKVLAYNAQKTIGKLCAVGFDEPRWNQYSSSLAKNAERYGVVCENTVVSNECSPAELSETLKRISERADVSGVILQQPLPKSYVNVVNAIDLNKDVDCLNPLSVCRLYNGEAGFRPATPQAVLNLLDYYDIDLQGKSVVILGRGSAVGKPLALMALQRNATVTICHTKTVDLPSVCRNADIIISACGVAGLVTNDFVTDKSTVIDVGLSFVNGVTSGDVSKEVYDKCAAVSPVPGGVGPVTRATLFYNLLLASKGMQ